MVIGIDKYAHYPQLYNAVADAKRLEGVLTHNYGFLPAHTTALYDEQATDIAIKQAIGKYRQLTSADTLVIYFSGHGFYEKPVGLFD